MIASWEGPFRVKQNLVNGEYKLEMINKKIIPRIWNGMHLKAYHVQIEMSEYFMQWKFLQVLKKYIKA